MKRFGMMVLTLSLFAMAGAFADEKEAKKGEDKKDDAKFSAAKIIGKWHITKGIKFGDEIEKKSTEGTIVFKKDVIQILGEKDKVEHEMTYTIDAKANPVSIDMKGTVGPAKDLSAEGIIELKGDTLKLCYSFPGEKRPTAFESKKDSKHLYFVMEKGK